MDSKSNIFVIEKNLSATELRLRHIRSLMGKLTLFKFISLKGDPSWKSNLLEEIPKILEKHQVFLILDDCEVIYLFQKVS